MTPQQKADEYLFLWRELRKLDVPPEDRLWTIDRLIELELSRLRKAPR